MFCQVKVQNKRIHVFEHFFHRTKEENNLNLTTLGLDVIIEHLTSNPQTGNTKNVYLDPVQ